MYTLAFDHHMSVLEQDSLRAVCQNIHNIVPRDAHIVACGMVAYGVLGALTLLYDRKVIYLRKAHDVPVCGKAGNTRVGRFAEIDEYWFVDDGIHSGTTYRYVTETIGHAPAGVLLYDDNTPLPGHKYETSSVFSVAYRSHCPSSLPF